MNEELDNKFAESFGKCFNNNRKNSEKFAECLSSASDRNNNTQKAIKYDGLFMTTSYQVCLMEKKDKYVCFEEFRVMLEGKKQKWAKEIGKI